jgi:hypothetical protein
MKRFNFILTMFIGLFFYFILSAPSSAVIFNDNFQAEEIYNPPESTVFPKTIYIEPLPSLVPPSYPYINTNPQDNKGSLQPENFSLDNNVGKEYTSSQKNR